MTWEGCEIQVTVSHPCLKNLGELMRNLFLKNWLGNYFKWCISDLFQPEILGTKHIIFLFVDHFELDGKSPRLSEWISKYPRLASKHKDFNGVPIRHTWFYALDIMREDELEVLRGLVDDGFGDVELHWHHSFDTPHSFRYKLLNGLEKFQKFGFMLPRESDKLGCFGFIHGNWSLNNGRGTEFCGVDNEIELLKRAGCYGDFTFPALHTYAQPGTVNSIYYAGFEPGRAGYTKGRRAEIGKIANATELMIFTGPLMINLKDWRFKWHPLIENGEIGNSLSQGDPKRIEAWLRAGIHVRGRPEWIFVKVFCHGGQDYESVLGPETDRMFSRLEEKFNDGTKFKLHYVTAREAHNIVKAAEEGMSGDPGQFREFGNQPVIKLPD